MTESIRGKVIRDLIARFSNDLLIGKKIKSGELRKKIVEIEPEWKCPEHLSNQVIEMENFTMELLEPLEEKSGKVILQLHGGGYVAAMKNAYRSFAALYSEIGKGCSVLTLDYRVAPENPYPAALEDAVTAYHWLIEQGYGEEDIVVAGDSAGGGLALSLCLWLKNHGEKLPAGIIAMSPWTDLTISGESVETNFEKDPLFGKTRDSLLYNKDYLGDNDPTNEYISPLFGNYEGFPPMLIQVGSYEMLLSDSERVADKAKEAGVKVKLSVYEGMFHVFQMAMLLMPESKQAWTEIKRFLNYLDTEDRT
ncbi:MAG: alpha/beta hydrolase [Lachnospiraceae bacterium]